MKYYKTDLSPAEKQTFVCHYFLLSDLINAYCSVHVSGGSLHVVLNDGNWDRSSIEFCLTESIKINDWVGIAICKILLEMPDEFIVDCDDLDYALAIDMWSQRATN